MSSSDSEASLSTSSSKKRTSTDEILDNLTATGRQKKIKLSDTLSEYRTAGRKAVATLHPFTNVSLAFHYGMTLDKGGSSSSNISEEQQTRFLAFYNTILDFVPGFRANLDNLSYDELKPYITAIHSSMSSQRSDDFSSLKYSMLEYILANRSTDTLQPPIPKSSCKSNRGVNHPRLARELCPKKWLDEFDKDTDLGMQRLQDGGWPLLATNWPSFLYPADAAYDAEDPITGLFRGHAGIRAFQHLYLGPAAAGSQDNDDEDSKHGGGKSKCTMYGLTKVTPQSWAWAMCVAWFSLCNCNSYRIIIGSFNLEEFFSAIVEALDDTEDPWAVETLKWINEQVFGKHAAKAMMATSNDADSDLAKMRAKRAARKQGAPLTAPPKPTAVPPPIHRPVTPPSRLPSLAPSSPLSLPPSPKPTDSEPATAPSELATAHDALAAPTDPEPPLTARRKVLPRPKPTKPKSSVRPTRLVASGAEVNEPAPVVPQKKKVAPRRGRKAD
ncbi:hypothetical protein DEU56DRAFT_917560 [Suillus clintonianus]|uniref:uncharacterized protein n=1 Tax=Suillus clintonianus TaxID=1904413 RepID=UPI001B86A5CD|nr:uncharacterized protein DEU56DRAFT_917560 [Suillus clintonianus]KAG2123251.1 hypothetical protein DEU56DRAFT_917560 [Suillus clintonianus]